MPASAYQFLPYVVAALPVLLAGGASAYWWNALARPWWFVVAAVVSLYGVAGLAVVIAIFIGPTFGGYFLETANPATTKHSWLPDVGVLVGFGVFAAIGFAILWVLKLWLMKR